MPARGTLTFLFSDVEGSTALLQRLGGENFAVVLDRQSQILADVCGSRGGTAVDRQGDGCMFAFASAADALIAAVQAQRSLREEPWREPVRVRMGLHTGEATIVEGRYVGVAVHRAARICGLAAGGQVLVSGTTREVAADALPASLRLDEFGRRKLKGLDGVERLFAVGGEPPAAELLPEPSASRSSGLPSVRIADADRERVAASLREHCVEGRLTLDEFSVRLDALYVSRTDSDLAAVLEDLPELSAPVARRKQRSWLITLFGSEQRRGPWRATKRLFAFSLIGSPDLDFRRAVVDSDEVRITSVAFIGSLTAIVPAGVDVDLGGFCLVGGNDFVTDAEVPAAPGGPRLRIRCYSLFGGAAIRHVRAGEAEEAPQALPPAQPG